jgi:hypothetical protein
METSNAKNKIKFFLIFQQLLNLGVGSGSGLRSRLGFKIESLLRIWIGTSDADSPHQL